MLIFAVRVARKQFRWRCLGMKDTIFDISEDNKKYALEVAKEANVNISFEVGDVLEIDLNKYGEYFDVVFMEGGVLHYFHDIDEFIMKRCRDKGNLRKDKEVCC